MKKIDLHIHTIKTVSDPPFEFSLETFKRYVLDAKLDAVAVTNHNVFSLKQYRDIAAAMPEVVVFPGIEVDVEAGHILVFAEPPDAEDFASKTALVEQQIPAVADRISVEGFKAIFGDLSRYLLIPHYEKHPPVPSDALERLAPFMAAGEVDSPKKFVRNFKELKKLPPVYFSDSRMKVGLSQLPIRQTYVDCGEVTLSSLKLCFRERKVALTEADGNRLWQALPNGQHLSTGLNVILGARSSGKTHTLNLLAASNENVKYIKQFELVQSSDDEKQFKGTLEKRGSTFSDQYLSGLKGVVEEMIGVDLAGSVRSVERYVLTLLKSAEDIDREDAFSNSALFSESDFAISKTKTLADLIRSVQQVIESRDYESIVTKHVQRSALIALICELIGVYNLITLENKKKTFVNEVVSEVRKILSLHTAATAVEGVDLYEVCMDQRRVSRFNALVQQLQTEKVIREEPVQSFRCEVRRKPYSGAGEIRAAGVKSSVSEAFKKYGNPYEYLRELLKDNGIPHGDLYKLFVKIQHRILNRDGLEVSGGERSEFRLLQEIQDAQNFDLLLIDEPESSFDNVFLRSDVNQVLKRIADHMPVVVVTHNSTVGASVGADYVLFTAKEKVGSEVVFRVYSGFPSSKHLESVDGPVIQTHKVLMDSLEAGFEAYEGRRTIYEAVKAL